MPPDDTTEAPNLEEIRMPNLPGARRAQLEVLRAEIVEEIRGTAADQGGRVDGLGLGFVRVDGEHEGSIIKVAQSDGRRAVEGRLPLVNGAVALTRHAGPA